MSPVSKNRRSSEKVEVLSAIEHWRTKVRNRYERHYRDSYFHFWADLLLAGILFALVISIVLLVFWKPTPAFTLEGDLSTSHILSGQSQELVIRYENHEPQTIHDVTIVLDVPKDFVIEDASPAEFFDKGTTTFELGDLEKNEKGQLVITGIIQGQPGDHHVINLKAMYVVAERKTQTLSSVMYDIEGSVLELEVEVPDRTYTNVTFDGRARVVNNGRRDLENVEVVFPQTDWTISSDNEDFSEAERRWTIQRIKAGEAVATDFFATPNENGSFNWALQAGWRANDIFVSQVKVERMIRVVGPALDVRAAVSGTGVNPSAPSLTASLEFANTTDQEISGIAFLVSSLRDTFSLRDVVVDSPAVSVNGNRITYLEPLQPGGKKTFDAKIDLIRLKTVLNDYAGAKILVVYDLNGQHFEYPILSPQIKVSSNLSLESGGYYYGPQGDQLGVGPLPPKVDIPTTYWVIWQINNLGNDLEAAEVIADLPENVVWPDQQSVSTGELSYSPVSRRILWKVGTVSRSGGNYRASFAVSIVPRSSEIGTIPELLKGITLTARDKFSGQILSKKAPIITTALEADHRSAGKGTVEALE